MFVLLILCLFIGCLILVPLLLVALALKLAIALVLIPFRIAGFAIKLALGLSLGLAALVIAGTVLLIPLLPIIALGFGIWAILRLSRRQPATTLATE
jgi:hypothetical protein